MAGEPTFSQLHIDRYLTDVSLQYRNMDYIADEIFPLVPVTNRSNLIPAYNQSHWFRSQARARAEGTKSARAGFTLDNTKRYFCERYSLGFEIPDAYRDNTDAPFDLDRDGTNFVTDQLQLLREVNFANNFMTAGIWGQDETGVAAAPGANQFYQFSDYTNSSPLIVITSWRDIVHQKIGTPPNLFVMGKPVWSQLKWNPEIIDSVKYTQLGIVSQQLFGELVEFDKVLIGTTIETTSPEGTAEASVTYNWVWPKDILINYTPGNPGLMKPAAGYTFVWQRVPDAIQYILRLRDTERELDTIEGNSYFDQQIVGKNAGLFAASAVA